MNFFFLATTHIYRETQEKAFTLNDHSDFLIIEESLFSSCSSVYGGAVFCLSSSNITIIASAFSKCTASEKGGAIFFIGKTMTIETSCFSSNQAPISNAIYSSSPFNSTYFSNSSVYECDLDDSLESLTFSSLILYFCMNNVTYSRGISIDTEIMFNLTYTALIQNSEFLSISKGNLLSSSNKVNIIRTTGPLTLFLGSQIVTEWSIISPNSFSISGNGNIIFSSCSFDKSQDELGISSNNIQNCQFGSQNINDLDSINSATCWKQNRYIYSEPPKWKIIVVALLIAILFLIGGIFIACENRAFYKRYQINEKEKKHEQELDELAAQQRPPFPKRQNNE